VRDAHSRTRALTPLHTTPKDSRLIAQERDGHSVALKDDVIWFFEKEADLLVCEIRRPADNQPGYEFEVASSSGPITHKFDTPQELIVKYLAEQRRLIKDGWRPRAGDIEMLD
jgi:hypothetical protein